LEGHAAPIFRVEMREGGRRVYFPALKMEAAGINEAVNYQAIQHHIPEDTSLHYYVRVK
jgi:hypothetical protein